MSSVNRQYNLLVAEDWKKVYQTFKDANFQSYDFETIRKSLIDYLRLYYPEDFNDFIESSEFISLIDLISYLGQSLAFRNDLNTRENFLDTAERRDSILKLARLISYNPKRAIPASGFLKIESVISSETLYDSNGFNLSNVPVTWNDISNDNWLEQFNLIFNAALINSQVIGKSGNSQVINGVRTDEYTLNIKPTTVPTYPFSAAVEGSSTSFEVVSATSINQSYVYEVPPKPTQFFNILYRNDNNGNASNSTGFFLYFKQGELKTTTFSLVESLPNRVVNVNYPDINNTDTWLYSLTAAGDVDNYWKLVPALSGINVVYNKTVERNIYQVNTKVNDQVELVFGDGSFSNIPQGNFVFYYRIGNNITYRITPEEMQNVTIAITYISRTGREETLTVRASLNYTVSNAVSRESAEAIRQNAPQQYYTQNRMITGEDYNIFPFTSFSDVTKAKAVNRTSSGISRFLDVNDPTGKYSSTSIFAEDGILYLNHFAKTFNFTFNDTTDISRVVYNQLLGIIRSQEMLHFYYDKFERFPLADAAWSLSSSVTNGSTGSFRTISSGQLIQIGHVTTSNAKYIRVGSIIKFSAPAGKYFNAQNKLATGTPIQAGDNQFLYAAVTQAIGDGTAGGTGTFSDGTGPVMLNQYVPTGAVVDQIIPVFKNNLLNDMINQIITEMLSFKNFGLTYNPYSQSWQLIEGQNLNTGGNFDLATQGNTDGLNLDSSWLVYFTFDGRSYTVGYRGLDYVFESEQTVKFYFDDKVKIFDPKTGTTVRDQIRVLKVNNKPDTAEPLGVDYAWHIYKNIVESDGFEDNNRILLTFRDLNNDGIPDNPDLFSIIVNPATEENPTPTYKKVFFKKETSYDSFIVNTPLANGTVSELYTTYSQLNHNIGLLNEGEIFYLNDDNEFYVAIIENNELVLSKSADYFYRLGRMGLYFLYKHHSPSYRRIDPSPNNIIDLYLLTNSYEAAYRNWIQDTSGKVAEPLPPTNEDLRLNFSSLENYKAISDTLIFNSVKFKPLFGNKADPALQAVFKVVKNPAVNISDNDIKSSVISAINNYFSTSNWDFGETFYFSELSAYLHSTLSPNISSVIIVPISTEILYGNLQQINAMPDEILISAATVNNVEVISSISAAQLNQNLIAVNT
jgi:hypothetical protein